MKKIYILIFLIVVVAAILVFTKNSSIIENNQSEILNNQVLEQNLPRVENNEVFQLALDRAEERAIKKPFGIFITPENSPVQPEKFSGYHTGVDFEIFPEEENADVEVKAICSGPILFQDFISGYGGVLVQACKFTNKDITVLYGHLNLASITTIKLKNFPAGGTIGILGKSFSQKTDFERKHLHLGIHSGKEINFRGYVQNQADLVNWFDVTKYFPSAEHL